MPTAGSIMDLSAALLNDQSKDVFTYVVQTPYLNLALKELQEELQQNNIPITNETSSTIIFPAGTLLLGYATTPALPADLVAVQAVYERLNGTTDDFNLLTQVEFLPPETEQIETLNYWCWQEQNVEFLGATTIRDLRIDYTQTIFPTVTSSNTNLAMVECDRFLAFKTASLAALYIGENPTRAGLLNNDAMLALDILINIMLKGKQAIATRRRPFMARYKVQGAW